MIAATPCPECGAELPADAPMGLCPRCVLGLGMPGGAPTGEFIAPNSRGPLPPPESLADRIPQLELLGTIGGGGMGVVYRARQTKLDRLVAVKVIRPEAAHDPGFAARFDREAKALARLNHPNIVMLHDFGETGDLCYLVMELVEGDDLRQRMKRGRLSVEQALEIAIQVCDALEYAHGQGVVHRDIKPENVLLDNRRGVKLADFGLAKVAQSSEAGWSLTATRNVLGTPHYMAPEQLERPREVDHRADIYAVGVLLYEMLTGSVPFGRYRPVSETVGSDPELDEILDAALARDPADRYQSVSDLKYDLKQLAEPVALGAPAPLLAAQSAAALSGGGDVVDPETLTPFGWLLGLSFFVGGPIIQSQLRDSLNPGLVRFAIFAVLLTIFTNALGWWIARVRQAGLWVVGFVIFFGWMALERNVTENLTRGLPRLAGYGLGMVLVLNLVAWWCWGEQREARRLSSLSGVATSRDRLERARRRLFGPAIGLIVLGGLNGCCLIGAVVTALVEAKDVPVLVPVMLSGVGLLGLGMVGLGVLLLENPTPLIARGAGILAMLPVHPMFLAGIPVGIWTLTRGRALEDAERALAGNDSRPRKFPIPGVSAVVGEGRGWGTDLDG